MLMVLIETPRIYIYMHTHTHTHVCVYKVAEFCAMMSSYLLERAHTYIR